MTKKNINKECNLKNNKGDTSPFFSIVCPFRNASKFLEKCVGTLLKQTYESFEIILVDDGSDDDSIKTIKKFLKENRVKLFRNKINKGPQFSRLKGVSLSKGKYILFLDCDDSFTIDALEILFLAIKSQNVEPDCVVFEYTKTNISSIECKTNKTQTKEVIDGKTNIIGRLFLDQISYYSWNKCFKRNIFKTLNSVLNDELLSLRYCEDLVLSYLCLSKCEKVLLTNASLYNYYQNPSGACSILDQKRIKDQISAYFYVFESIFQNCAFNNFSTGFCTNLNATIILKIYLEFFSSSKKEFVHNISLIRDLNYVDYSLSYNNSNGFSGFLITQFRLKKYKTMYILISIYTFLFRKKFEIYKK